ncbi:hypothetical protein N7453_009813 [Penicillium expansum]|nr:hypothetical protein N7453_009813 [Penicillium expansum]
MFQELEHMPGFGTTINIWNSDLSLVKDTAANITYSHFIAYSSAILTGARCQRLRAVSPSFSRLFLQEDQRTSPRSIGCVSQFGYGYRQNGEAK